MIPEFIQHIEIARDNNGKARRIYMALAPIDIKPLEAIQHRISSFIVPKSAFHLTLFHFGKPEDLYEDIRKQNTTIKLDFFWEKFLHLLVTTSTLNHSSFTLQAESVDVFNIEDKSSVVLLFEKTPELHLARNKILFFFQSFLKECGIENTEEFMGNSKNLQFQTEPNYKPHITLGMLLLERQMPITNQSMPAITFTGARIFNIKIVY